MTEPEPDPDQVVQQDLARTIRLPGSEWGAAVGIDPEGNESLWLVSPEPDQKPGCACAKCAPHEQDTTPRRKERTT